MARVKATDTIKLACGGTMPLGQALDEGLVHVDRTTGWTRKSKGERREVDVYIAYETCHGETYMWEIGQKLFESRYSKSFKPRDEIAPSKSGAVDLGELRRLLREGDWDAVVTFIAQAQVDAGYDVGYAGSKWALQDDGTVRQAYSMVINEWGDDGVDEGAILDAVAEYGAATTNPRRKKPRQRALNPRCY